MNTKDLPKRVKEALSNIDYSDLYAYFETREFVELIVNRYGDTCAYRVYNNGDITER